jgi:aspartate kinase
MTARKPPVVAKFGGASLDDPEHVVSFVRRRTARGERLVLVVSARRGVTDLLQQALARPRSVSGHAHVLAKLRRRHPGLPPSGRRHLDRLERLLADLEMHPDADGPRADRLLSQGERIAVHWIAGLLRAAGVPATPVEADHLGLITDNAYGASCLLLDRSRRSVRAGLGRLLDRGDVPVVTGYFGRSLEGRVATLGRGGSDYAATGIAALLGAKRVELVKRNVAVYSADPNEVPRARPLRDLSYEEAEELAQFGARVLHPLTIEPARAYGLSVTVRSLDDPHLSTTIGPGDPRRRNRAITLLRPLRLFRLRVPGGRQRPGVVAEVADRLTRAHVNVVQLFTSSALLCLLVEPGGTKALERALAPITADAAAVLDGPHRVALVTVIGDRVLDDLDRLPSAAVARAEGFSATPRALSLAVPEERGPAVVLALHRALVERGAS